VAEKEGVELEQDAAHVIGQKADGSLRDSLSIFDQIVSFAGNKVNYKTVIENLNILDYDYYFKVMKAIVQHDIPTVLTVLDEILENGFDGHNFITGLSEHFRNLLVCKDEGMIQLLEVGEGIKEKYQTQADQCEQRFLINALSIANKCDVNYNHNVNKRLNIELALLQLCSLGLAGVELQPAKYSIADPPEDTVPKKAEEPAPEYKRRQEPSTKEAKTDINPIDSAEEEKRSKESKEREEEKTAGVQEEKPVEEKVDQEPEKKTQSKGTTSKESSPAEEKPQDTENMRKHRLTSHTISINPEIDQETVENKDSLEPTDHNADGLALAEIETTVFLDAWDSFSKKLYESGKHSLCSTLTKRKPIVKPNNMVELPIDNIVQETEVNEIKTELQEYLKESLGLSKVKVITTIVKDEKTKKPYTALEKFNRMAEKNPSIDQLREQLGLDLD
jgi:DNA polymerase-3 subunit gamma/tau